jgi:hypothetical protein
MKSKTELPVCLIFIYQLFYIIIVELGEKPEDIKGCLRSLRATKETGQPVQYEIVIPNVGGKEISDVVKYYWACMFPLNRQGKCAFFGQEITSRKQQEKILEDTVRKRTEELQNALTIKSRFVATMSHGI